MGDLSIFIDESGDWGKFSRHSPYYLISMVFHDQNFSISAEIAKLNQQLKDIGLDTQTTIHTMPLIRREEIYNNMLSRERKLIFSRLFFFAQKCNIKYRTFIYKKKELNITFDLEAKITKEISWFIRDNLAYFQNYDNVILYYDNGQMQLNRILNNIFNTELNNFHLKFIKPLDYKLFQVADLLCTMELLNLKIEDKTMSKSDKLIFKSGRDFRQDFYKPMRKNLFSGQ